MFNWFKKEAPLKALAGMGGGVGRGGVGSVDVEIHMYGGKSNEGGRGGDSPYGGWTTISGTATPGTTIAYICGSAAGGLWHSMMVDLEREMEDARVVDLRRFGLVVVILHQLLEIQIIF